ncbi:MAG: response regulator [Chloroflexota bacterium]|nr:response regulator [Chloroflexota bacterium]
MVIGLMAKVLIVDDEKALVELIASVVEDLGHQALCAYDGSEALKLAQSEKPQIIFCDIMMPVMTGYELLDQVRQDNVLATTPVVMMSAAKIDRIRAASANGYMPKPFDLDKIADYINNLPH